MARKVGGSTQRLGPQLATKGILNGAPPPSTIPAQIVQNATNINAQRERGERCPIAPAILSEFLQNQKLEDPDATVVAFIAAIAEGAIDFLFEEDPFAIDRLKETGALSIESLDTIIRQRPYLLLRPQGDDNDESHQAPVFIWLFPKLLGVLGLKRYQCLHGRVQDLLCTCLDVFCRSTGDVSNARSILRLYRSCVENILESIGRNDEALGVSSSSSNVVLPSSSSIGEFWPDSQRFVALPQGLQRTFKSSARAIFVGCQLLQAIARSSLCTGKRCTSFFGPGSQQPWILDTCLDLWHRYRQFCAPAPNGAPSDQTLDVLMQLLGSTALSQFENGIPSCTLKSIVTFASAISDMVAVCFNSAFPIPDQMHLAILLVRLRTVLEIDSERNPSSERRQQSNRTVVFDQVETSVSEACQEMAKFNSLHRDLKLALCLWISPGEWPAEVNELRSLLRSEVSNCFSSDALNQESTVILKALRGIDPVGDERPTKRRRTVREITEDDHLSVYSQLVIAVNGSSVDSPVLNVSDLHNTVRAKYATFHDPKQSEQEQCELLLAFGRIACAGSRCLQSNGTEQGHWTHSTCTHCDIRDAQRRRQGVYWNNQASDDAWKDVIAALIVITEQDVFEKSSKPRVLMASAIGRLYNHISEPGYLDLHGCALGQWLMGSMSRSLRELRITASRSLMVFLRDDVSQPERDRNRRAVLQFLNELGKRNMLPEQEMLIMAYGQAARVCSEVELPIILDRLVEYLGHTNPVIYGVAYNELSSLADDLGTSPRDMLCPYWRSIGFTIVKDVLTKPQKADLVAGLLELTTADLLDMLRAYVLPTLVLNKRKDILERIARVKSTSVDAICSQPRRNLARILAMLLCQHGADNEVEARSKETLWEVAPGFKSTGQELHHLVLQEPMFIACEILELAADQTAKKKKPFHSGFRRLAALSTKSDGKGKSKDKNDPLETFIQMNILGIMASFFDVIENTSGVHQLFERKKCLGAIGELIALAGSYVSYALPQFRACLQSAMSDSNLCDLAFDLWSKFLAVLDQEDLEPVIDQTFALIVHHWPSFSDETRLLAHKTLDTLRQDHNLLLQSRIGYIPSLASIPMMSKLEAEIARLKAGKDRVALFHIFSQRCSDERDVVVRQALKELIPYLEENQKLLHQSTSSQKPIPALTVLSRSLLDACVRFAENYPDIPLLCAQCLGLIGGLDPYRVETVREKKSPLMLSNFKSAAEVTDFAGFMLEEILIKVFLSTSNAKSQGFLAFVMQELCKACGFRNEFAPRSTQKPGASQPTLAAQRWNQMPESVRNTLLPFTSSRYHVKNVVTDPPIPYPIFRLDVSHATWLRTFVYDLLHKAKEHNAKIVFHAVARVIKKEDLSIASFILPFAVLSVLVDGEESDVANIRQEFLQILGTDVNGVDHIHTTNVKKCSEDIFQTLDYLARWLQEKKKHISEARMMAGKTGRGISKEDEIEAIQQVSAVESLLQLIPAKIISMRAVECGSYARALFHWEQYYREEQAKAAAADRVFANDELLQHLQFIYAQIDEPDGIEGISAQLQVLNPEQQVMEHRKAGRWTAAQAWYELALAERPNDMETQINLLTCLKASGQYDAILNYIEGFYAAHPVSLTTLPFAVEAAWSSGKWTQLEKLLSMCSDSEVNASQNFNVGIGKAILALRRKETSGFKEVVSSLRQDVAKALTPTTTASLTACHDQLLKLHALYELEAISGMSDYTTAERDVILENLDRRLDIIGTYTADKQYILGIRRAAMQLSRFEFTNLDIASAWLTTARLARKGEFTSAAFSSILHAQRLGDDASKIEYSKMLWKEGHHRKAIQNIRGALSNNSFQTRDTVQVNLSVSVTAADQLPSMNKVKCHAQLLLAKWLDRSGQTQVAALKEAYATGIMTYPRWDKGHYYLGRYYLKLYEAEKQLLPQKRSDSFLAGELTKLVIENYVRSTVYGSKYYYQTIPKVLTLWLDMGLELVNTQPRLPKDKEWYQLRLNHLDHISKYLKRYASERMPAFTWYTAFSQIVTRISHPNKSVWEVLQLIILKVAAQYPQQALWSLLAVIHSTQDDRRARGMTVLQKLRDHSKRKNGAVDLKSLILHGQRLTDALLAACDAPIEQRVVHVSLSRELGFSHKLAPCPLVVPIEANLIPTLPAGNDSRLIRIHNPFPQGAITIDSFMDEVLVLSSLQRPRRVTVRGSDGNAYGLLCKPKDDLRKDQRLMEFNAMINRALQRDIESSKRRLYIKTYGVTPLNEECGTIEWVEGLKPMRDIIIRLYRQQNILIDYSEIRMLLNEACSDPSKTPIFTHKILAKFPPVLHEWFVETFPEPQEWFRSRLRYTRSCAVMSIVGHVLGLGDRHGENVLLEEGNGGTFHVDFNCLFDKGLTFEKPELVPFRLTHNMVDAMGPQGIEGPFRKAAELTYSLLRQHEDTLITILETFVHDPTADFLGSRKKRKIPGVPETPQEVLEIVKQKVAGQIRGESVPLSVEGYVDALIGQARDPRNLAAMYIGWCAFF